MNRSRLALASLLLLGVGFGGSLSSTSTSFTAAASVPANSVSSGALEDPQPTAGPVTVGSATLSWNAAPTGGITPSYSLTRSNGDGTEPTSVYTGAATTYSDGGIPAELKSRDIMSIATGPYHSLAVDADDHVYAWGYNRDGQLGTGDKGERLTPFEVTFPAGVDITSVAVGNSHSLAIDTNHHVYAWGNNNLGQLGTDDTAERLTPTEVAFPAGVDIISIAAGGAHSLALDTNHNVYAWGYNDYGQLGTDDTNKRLTPTKIASPTGVDITSIAAGSYHSLALDTNHNVYAWGFNRDGQLGTDDTNKRLTPTEITFPDDVDITSIDAGDFHSLALDTTHHVYAWGYNYFGQLGTSDTTQRLTPTEIAFPTKVDIASISAGSYNALALDTNSNIYAWGYNYFGQLGTRDTTQRLAPTEITSLTGMHIASLAAGIDHSLALDTNGHVYAWGSNNSGLLGTGDNTNRLTPTRADTTYKACPPGLTLAPQGSTCSLLSGHTYRYTVTTTLGGWTRTSAPLTLTTKTG